MENTTLDQEMLVNESTSPEFKIAGRGKRFANSIIDTICFYVLVFILAFMFGIFKSSTGEALDGIMGFMLIGSYFLYFILLEGWLGKTVGKMITGTKVVDPYGKQIRFATATAI